MDTIADKLELLMRTKERQKAYLKEKYPLLDFDTIPFRAYLDLFQGRSYVPGFVGGWKAYGRSNDEDADTRKYLYDYSGNGRDIELFNFAFAGMSGYGGPVAFMPAYWSAGGALQVISFDSPGASRLAEDHFEITSAGSNLWLTLGVGDAIAGNYSFPQYSIEVEGLEGGTLVYRYKAGTNLSENKTLNLQNGKNIIPGESFSIEALTTNISFIELVSTNAIFTKLDIRFSREYHGALVSDGIDDYGQCIKDFALPDDYTVVAVRKIMSNKGDLAAKSLSSNTEAFISDIEGNKGRSYGGAYSSKKDAALFSYQTKTSYNGVEIIPGGGVDSNDAKFRLFNMRENYLNYMTAALYDLRIYDHSLTAEELQTVKDEMMADYEKATGGGISGITYVADWDAKGRSNDEAEPVRSQWTDKVNGKVINLSNYAYSGMSGWNGYPQNMNNFSPSNSNISKKSDSYNRITIAPVLVGLNSLSSYINASIYNGNPMRIKGYSTNRKARLSVVIWKNNFSEQLFGQTAPLGEIVTVPSFDKEAENISFVYCSIEIPSSIGETFSMDDTATIELLPNYPGALVSDGVDDYGTTAENIPEEIGTVIIHTHPFAKETDGYIIGSSWAKDKIFAYLSSATNMIVVGDTGKGDTAVSSASLPIDENEFYSFSRVPAALNDKLSVASTNAHNAQLGSNAIYRFILIKEQLDAAQLEFLMWKAEKEYRDWCRANGYDYAIPETIND